jgi:hypothetical protein
MAIGLTCSCGKRLLVSDEFAGRQGQCPACGGLLQIPERDATVTSVAPSSDKSAQAVAAALGLAYPKDPAATEDAVTPLAGSAAESHHMESGGPEEGGNEKLTGVGCILTLITVAVIFGVAIPIARWRDPATGQPLPRVVAIASAFVIGAAVHGFGSLLLRLIGLQVWSKRKMKAER